MKKIKIKNVFKEEGFTLIETTIVLLVIGILSLLLLPNISKVTETANSNTNQALITTVEAQIELYKANKNEDPSDLDLVEDGYVTQKQLDAYNKSKP